MEMAKVNPRSGTRKKIVVPTYAQAAVWSPIMLISLWVLQGFSAGGEWDGAAPITVERAPVGQRSFFGSFPQIGTPIGMIIATLMLLLFTGMLTNHQFLGWDWRLPFLFSMVLIALSDWRSGVPRRSRRYSSKSSCPSSNHPPSWAT